jgi:hypothetical protein
MATQWPEIVYVTELQGGNVQGGSDSNNGTAKFVPKVYHKVQLSLIMK